MADQKNADQKNKDGEQDNDGSAVL